MIRPSDTMQDYLAATTLCDFAHPWFRAQAKGITAGANTQEAKALSIFYHVRDGVRFGLAYSRSRASQILKRGYGDCLNKTKAQVALLRAVGIPARIHWVQAESRALNQLIAGFVYRNMPPVVSHFWGECFLYGTWVSCELLLDKPLYRGMLEAGLITRQQVPTIDWDGKTDLVLLKPWITEDWGHLPSFEEAMRVLHASEEGMPPRWIEWLIAPLFYPFSLRSSDRIRQGASGGPAGSTTQTQVSR